MTPVLIDAAAIPPQRWRNGGGQTRELLVWPAQGPWQLRISRADIDVNGPFSSFPGVTRWFAVLHGRGVALSLDGHKQSVLADGDALCFDGAQAPACELLDGPTQDLNLMAIGGTSVMARVVPSAPWDGPCTLRGLYTTVAGQWHSARQQCTLQADQLLWQDQPDAGPWVFTPAPGRAGSAWWLGFAPDHHEDATT